MEQSLVLPYAIAFYGGQAWGKDMLVIALTGWGLHEDKRKTQAAGVDAHLVKPVAPAALEQMVAELSAARAR